MCICLHRGHLISCCALFFVLAALIFVTFLVGLLYSFWDSVNVLLVCYPIGSICSVICSQHFDNISVSLFASAAEGFVSLLFSASPIWIAVLVSVFAGPVCCGCVLLFCHSIC